MTSKPASQPDPARVADADATSATFGYLGAIFLGPVIPLAVYVLRSRRSTFMRYHAATAVNLSSGQSAISPSIVIFWFPSG